MSDLATLEHDGAVARLTLNRPDARNAFSIEMLHDLHARLDEFGDGGDAKVVVITGAGKSFAAGMDLKQVVVDESGPELPGQLLASLGRFNLRLRRLPQVTVARVNGAAIGGGCGLACACDIAVSHADAKLGYPEVDLGICPAVVAPILVRKIGAGPARKVLLMGGIMSGEEAYRIGIVDELAPNAGELDALTEDLVGRLAAGGPRALAATKALVNELDGSLDEALVEKAAALSASVLVLDEAQAALKARLK
ncbi:MAG: enoyl-CoA hydratase/isomerase family protein [Planctomycetota bacterium]